jgi:hypothetical protein
MLYLYTIKFYLAPKKNEILSFAVKWMELENIILNEVSQAQKTKTCMFSLICGFAITNTAILWDTHDTKGKLCKGGIGQGKETKT